MSEKSSSSPQQVVGIGASAGGLEALERFFENVPADTQTAFVVVQHLSPDFKSLMDELLARRTKLPIRLVEDGMTVEPGHVYLIPPKKEMIISGGRLLLSERDPQAELTLPIDVFFRSLAQDCGPRAVAIVLSGGGSDGSRGIRDVYSAGGLVIVQDVATAQFDGMPKTARDTGVAHWVLAPEQMPAVLLDHALHPLKLPSPEVASSAHSAIYRMLMDEYGIDFTHYKPSTITRRIERRLLLAHTPDIEEYTNRLKRDRQELDVLYRDLLIGVTRFFRDPEAFDVLEQKVLPELLRRGSRNTPVRLWVAGCATGEEPYSLAILCQELMAKMGIERQVKIFATDVHRDSIDRATRAMYDEEAIAHVSPERLARYFFRTGKMYQVVPEIRQMVVFAQHDVIKDAPFTRVDFVSCRNLLIYFQPAAQHKVLSLFHFALNRGGVLFLGPSESAGPIAHDFETIDKHWRTYRKHTDARVPVDRSMQPAPSTTEPRVLVSPPRHPLGALLSTYDALLDEAMPPSFLVTDHGELVHAFGGASKFLRANDGRVSLDIVDLVDTELKMVLAGGLKRASQASSAIVFKGVRIREEAYKVTIRRVRNEKNTTPHLLVSFETMDGPVAKPETTTEIDLRDVSGVQLAALEAELSHTKENLQAAIEELQASNEELQASNEELQAANEELQSTNEELQSVNEELYTVNAEYQRKIGELTELTNDMDNLLSSTEVGTVFLDHTLNIRKFTPQIAETFSFLPHDVGRSIETFAHKLAYPALIDELKRVVATGVSIERELRDVQGRSYFLRLLPYRAKGKIDGVVLTLIDVSGLKAAEDALFHERYLLNSLLLSVPDAIYFKDARGRFIRMNQGMARRLGLGDAREAVGRTVFELNGDRALELHQHDEEVLRTGEVQAYKLEQRSGEGGEIEWDLVSRLPLRDNGDRIVGIIVIYRNVTEQRRAEAKIQEAVRRRDQFLAMLSHELRNPLGAIVTATGLLRSKSPSAQKNPDRLLDVLERQSQQMARLLDDLLEASRVTQNKIELRKTVVDLRTIIRDTIDALRSQVDSRGLDLKLDVTGEPLYILGDPARLQQIHANLLSNAAKYTPRGGHITIEANRIDGHAHVRVRDDGVGIPKDMLESVFDLFVQSNRTLERAAGGLGVGLTLVKSLVGMHGGEVTAESEGDGKGSALTVRFPLATEAPPMEVPVSRPRTRVPAGAKVVIVEDNVDSREMLCEALEHAGFHCHTAGNGIDAIALIDKVKPDIAILDVGLPGIDGFEIARRVRANEAHANICLIALTGYGQASDRITAREAGFDEHLVKPARPETLLALISEMRSADTRRAPMTIPTTQPIDPAE
jgi:two-component system, chemotaxis family, CheB/CheR fusion protein